MNAHRLYILALAAAVSLMMGWASDMHSPQQEKVPADSLPLSSAPVISADLFIEEICVDSIAPAEFFVAQQSKPSPVSLYALPYKRTLSSPDWHRLWVNTAVLTGAFTGTLLVLECLPSEATAWNRAEIQNVPLFRRWYNNVIRDGVEWDHDKAIFNFVLHPYAGAAYFMAARSCGFNYYQSLLYCAAISTVCWEFGIEAFMERPSIQDIFITPICGSLLGEGFYLLKREIVNRGYELLGSRFLGGFAAFLLDPVNEFIGLFAGNPARKVAGQVRIQPTFSTNYTGFCISATF